MLRNRFAGWADDYQLFEELIDNNDKMIQTELAKLLSNFADRGIKLLDIGCGTGNTISEVIKYCPNADISGIDLDKEMVNHAKSRFPNFTFAEGDAIKIMNNLGQFDVIISILTIHNIDPRRRDELVKLVHQHLKPGGIFIVGDKMIDDEDQDEYKKLYFERIEKMNVLSDAGRDDLRQLWQDHEREDFPRLDTVKQMIKRLEKANFTMPKKGRRLGLYRLISANIENPSSFCPTGNECRT